MTSPSMVSSIRSTPWVEGCCGPMLMTMRSSSTASGRFCHSPVVATVYSPSKASRVPAVSSAQAPAAGRVSSDISVLPLVGWRDGGALVHDLDPAQRVVLAVGMPFPVVGQHDPGEGG